VVDTDVVTGLRLWTGLAGLCVLAGFGASAAVPSRDHFLLLGIALAAVSPIVLRVAQHRFDVFEPSVPVAIGVLLLFVARPLYEEHHYGFHSYVTINVDQWWTQTLVACLVGVVAFQLGYLAPIGGALKRRLVPIRPAKDDSLITLAAILTGVALAGLLARAHISGGVSQILANRAGGLTHAAGTATATVVITLAIPAILILWTVTGPARKMARRLSVIPLGVYLLLALPGGNRRYLLILLAAIAVYRYLRLERRPPILQTVIGVFLLLVLVVNPVRMARTGSMSYTAAVQYSVSNPFQAPADLLAAQDSSVIDSFAMLVGDIGPGQRLAYQHGKSTLTETILQPLPHALVPWRPQAIRDQEIQARFDNSAGFCSTLCPAFPSVATFYADWGLPSVFVGCLLVGAFARWWWELFRLNRDQLVMQATYSSTYFLWFYFWWSSLGFIVIQFALFVLPLLVARGLGSRRSRARTGPMLQSWDLERG
jgi:hypothetical protein